MDYNEFLETIQKKRGKKNFTVSGSWGVYDAYIYIRKNKWFDIGRPVKTHEFYSIVRKVNALLAQEFIHGNSIQFPHCMGVLELREVKRGVRLNDEGRLVNTYPINWGETMKLWYRDEEARKSKTLIRMENKRCYGIHYNKHKARYRNQRFYMFTPNRFLRRAMLNNIRNDKMDTLW